MKPKVVAETIMPWLRANLGSRCLAPLTGPDARALRAAVQIIDLYCYCPSERLIEAFGKVVATMQPHCQEFAYHSIAHVMNWEDRPKIWADACECSDGELVELPQLTTRRCAFEPGGSGRVGT